MLHPKGENFCSGCDACEQICSQGAIKLMPDEKGFRYPYIDKNKCTNCGLCRTVCPWINEEEKFYADFDQKVFAVKHRSEDVRKNSTSGGLFTALTDYVLSLKGVVYGAAFGENLQIQHMRAATASERNRFRGAKYVQSDMSCVYRLVEDDLKKNKLVLFSGTPCQVHGLKKYLQIKRILTSNLVLVDLVCHGVASPQLWMDHLKNLSTKYPVQSYKFRSKIQGWHTHLEQCVLSNGKALYKQPKVQYFRDLFGKNLSLRPSCGQCQYANLNRIGDLTIGDFWGIEKCMPEFDDNQGVSLAIINSSKGFELFQRIQPNILSKISNTTECLQPQLQYPTVFPSFREQFWGDYFKYGYLYTARKWSRYGKPGVIVKMKILIKTLLKQI